MKITNYPRVYSGHPTAPPPAQPCFDVYAVRLSSACTWPENQFHFGHDVSCQLKSCTRHQSPTQPRGNLSPKNMNKGYKSLTNHSSKQETTCKESITFTTQKQGQNGSTHDEVIRAKGARTYADPHAGPFETAVGATGSSPPPARRNARKKKQRT